MRFGDVISMQVDISLAPPEQTKTFTPDLDSISAQISPAIASDNFGVFGFRCR
jgi:hypothetical protein